VSVSVILFPFVNHIAGFVKKLVPVEPGEAKKKVTAYIDEKQYSVPSVAINEAKRELLRLGEITAKMIELSCQALIEKDENKAEQVLDMEDNVVDRITDELEHFVNTLMHSDLSHKQQSRSFQIKTLLIDIERVGDMTENIAQYVQDRCMTDIPFTDEATEEFEMLWRYVHTNYNRSLQAFREVVKLRVNLTECT